MSEEVIQENYGLIDGDPNPSGNDYIAGIGNGIVYDIFNEARDWTAFLSRSEKQSGVYFDTYGCVSFSALNCLDVIFNYKI